MKQADRDDGTSAARLSTNEREELRELRKKLRQMKQERDILAKEGNPTSRLGSLGRPKICRQDLPIHKSAPGRIPHLRYVPSSGGLHQWLLRMAHPPALEARPKRCDVNQANQADL